MMWNVRGALHCELPKHDPFPSLTNLKENIGNEPSPHGNPTWQLNHLSNLGEEHVKEECNSGENSE